MANDRPSEAELANFENDTQEILEAIAQDKSKEATPVVETAEIAEETTEEVAEQKQEEVQQPKEESPAEIKPEISRQIPLAKYQDKKKKWEEERIQLEEENKQLKAKLEQTTTSRTESQPDQDLGKLAEKWGLDEELLKDLTKAVGKTSIPDEIIQEIHELREEKLLAERKEFLEKQYQDELNSLTNNFKDIDFSKVDKDKLKALAFGEYSTTPLEVIFKAFKDDLVKPAGTKSVESSRPNSSIPSKDIASLSEAEALKLPGDQFDEWVAAKEKGGFLRRS